MLPGSNLPGLPVHRNFTRVGSSQPFNYRDTLSTLDYINQVVHHVKYLQHILDDNADIINGDLNEMDNELNHMWHTLCIWREQMIDLIKQAAASDNIIVWSPVYGRRVPLQAALDDTYDADRYHGLFVKDFDDLNLSPKQFDNLQISPRRFDLFSTEKINAVQGDITAADITWLKGD